MRKLMWFALGFTAACVAGVYLVSDVWLLILGVFCLCAGVPLLFLKKRYYSIAAVILIGGAVSFGWIWGYDTFYVDTARSYDGQTVETVIQITDYSYNTDYGVAADGKINLEGKSFKIRVYLVDDRPLYPGDRITGKVRLRLTVEGGMQESTYHQGNGVFLLGYMREETAVESTGQADNRYFAAKLRKGILDTLDRIFPADTLAFARALLLGDSSKLTYEEDTAFKVSGIRHVIAVSGLHVSILFSLVYLISGRRRVLTFLLGIPILVVFAAVAGFTPSIVRACIMQALVLLALLLDKEYDPPTALSAAVLVMLLINPMTITSVSFQLSVSCMIGIFLFSRKIHDYLLRGKRAEAAKGKSLRAKMIRWTVNTISVSLSATIMTTPLCAWYFGMVSIIGILTNILTLWIVSFVFYGIMLGCVAGAIWLPAGQAVAWVVSWPMRYILWVAKLLAGVPFAAVYTCSVYIVIWLVLTYCLVTAFLLSKKKHPILLTGCILIGLIISILVSYIEPRLDNYRVSVLDVGQGQCILLQSKGENYLVDCGGSRGNSAADTATAMLLSQGITRLDGIIITHYDKDHAGGVEPLLSRVEAEKIYLPDTPDDGGIKASLSEKYADSIQWISENTALECKRFRISLFPADSQTEGNESSMCILFQQKNCDILITGDRGASGERALMASTQLPELELLVVGHHGSGDATCFDFLETTKPKAAAISVGADNNYGHPTQQVLIRLSLFGTQVWRTDIHGTILFKG